MYLRIFGIAGTELYDIHASLRCSQPGLRIEGVPSARARTQADRVRAALVSSGLGPPLGLVVVQVQPEIYGVATPCIDLPIALAVAGLSHGGSVQPATIAEGRLGLDGTLEAWWDGRTRWRPWVGQFSYGPSAITGEAMPRVCWFEPVHDLAEAWRAVLRFRPPRTTEEAARAADRP